MYSGTCKRQQQSICDNIKRSVLKLLVQDIHYHINFLKRKLSKIENNLHTILPRHVFRNIKEFQLKIASQHQTKNISVINQKVEDIQNKTIYNFHQAKFSLKQHKQLPEFSYNNDPWLTNLSKIQIPNQVQDLLRLGDNFCNPVFTTTL